MSPQTDNHGENQDKSSASSTQAQASTSPRCITPISDNCPSQYSYYSSSQDDFTASRFLSSNFDETGDSESTTDAARDINSDFAELDRLAEAERQARIDRLVETMRAEQSGTSSSTATSTSSTGSGPTPAQFMNGLVVDHHGLLTPCDTPTPNPTPSGSHIDGDQSVEPDDEGSTSSPTAASTPRGERA